MRDLKGQIKNILAVILALFLVVLIIDGITDIKDKMDASENTIIVSDIGTVYAKPDLGVITVSVVTEAKTVAEAMAENTEKMNKLTAAVKNEGVEEKDLKTVSFYVYPRYEWYEKSDFYSQDRRVLVGYEISQSLEVKIRDLAKIGSIIEAATDTGANQVSDLQLVIDNQEELKKQARQAAIGKAKAKAEELAKQLGVKLIAISSFSESGTTPYFYGLEKSIAAPIGLGGGEDSLQMETGENKIEITVYITYKIK